MLTEVEAHALFVGAGPQRHDRPTILSSTKLRTSAVDDRRGHGRELDAQLRRVPEQQTVGDAVQAFLREHPGQQRADRAAETMRGNDVE